MSMETTPNANAMVLQLQPTTTSSTTPPTNTNTNSNSSNSNSNSNNPSSPPISPNAGDSKSDTPTIKDGTTAVMTVGLELDSSLDSECNNNGTPVVVVGPGNAHTPLLPQSNSNSSSNSNSNACGNTASTPTSTPTSSGKIQFALMKKKKRIRSPSVMLGTSNCNTNTNSGNNTNNSGSGTDGNARKRHATSTATLPTNSTIFDDFVSASSSVNVNESTIATMTTTASSSNSNSKTKFHNTSHPPSSMLEERGGIVTNHTTNNLVQQDDDESNITMMSNTNNTTVTTTAATTSNNNHNNNHHNSNSSDGGSSTELYNYNPSSSEISSGDSSSMGSTDDEECNFMMMDTNIGVVSMENDHVISSSSSASGVGVGGTGVGGTGVGGTGGSNNGMMMMKGGDKRMMSGNKITNKGGSTSTIAGNSAGGAGGTGNGNGGGGGGQVTTTAVITNTTNNTNVMTNVQSTATTSTGGSAGGGGGGPQHLQPKQHRNDTIRSSSSSSSSSSSTFSISSTSTQQQQQQQQPEGWRVKLYRLNDDGGWDDCGTGRIVCLLSPLTPSSSTTTTTTTTTTTDNTTTTDGNGTTDGGTGQVVEEGIGGDKQLGNKRNRNQQQQQQGTGTGTGSAMKENKGWASLEEEIYQEIGQPVLCMRTEMPQQHNSELNNTITNNNNHNNNHNNNNTNSNKETKVLLQTRVLLRDTYQRQGDNIITWCEPFSSSPAPRVSPLGNSSSMEQNYNNQQQQQQQQQQHREEQSTGVDLALSFQDNAGCLDIWNNITNIQNRSLELFHTRGGLTFDQIGAGGGGGGGGGNGNNKDSTMEHNHSHNIEHHHHHHDAAGGGGGGGGLHEMENGSRHQHHNHHHPQQHHHQQHQQHQQQQQQQQQQQRHHELGNTTNTTTGYHTGDSISSHHHHHHHHHHERDKRLQREENDGTTLDTTTQSSSSSSSSLTGQSQHDLRIIWNNVASDNNNNNNNNNGNGGSGNGSNGRLDSTPGSTSPPGIPFDVDHNNHDFIPTETTKAVAMAAQYVGNGGDMGNSSSDMNMNMNTTSAQLPNAPKLDDLESIADLLARSQPQQREAIASFIFKSDCAYLNELLSLFPSAEGAAEVNRNFHALATLASIIKSVILLNDSDILEYIASDGKVFEDCCCCLEYDPDLREKANHRWFFRDRLKFRTVIPIKDKKLIQDIHKAFRITYIRDTLLRPTMDESSLQTLGSILDITQRGIITNVRRRESDYFDKNTTTTTTTTTPHNINKNSQDSFLMRVIRLLAIEVKEIRNLEWEKLDSKTRMQEGKEDDEVDQGLTKSTPIGGDRDGDISSSPPGIFASSEIAEDSGGSCWRQHLVPQDESLKSRKIRRRGCLSFLRELFNMVRMSVDQLEDKNIFFTEVIMMKVSIPNEKKMSSSTKILESGSGVHQNSMDNVVLLSLLGAILSDPKVDASERGICLEILYAITTHSPTFIRKHCLEEYSSSETCGSVELQYGSVARPQPNEKREVIFNCPPDDLLLSLIFVMAIEKDVGILLQVSEIIRVILEQTDVMNECGQMGGVGAIIDDSDEPLGRGSRNESFLNGFNPAGGGAENVFESFLQIFYEHYVAWLVAPFQYRILVPNTALTFSKSLRHGKDTFVQQSQELYRIHHQLQEISTDRSGLLYPVMNCAVRASFSVELLSFCVRAHCRRMKRFLLTSKVLSYVLKFLSPKSYFHMESGDRCLKLAALRCLRSILVLKDESYHRHIVQQYLFTPVFDAFRANPVGDNLVSSAIIEICDFINNENIQSLIEYIVTKHLYQQNQIGNSQVPSLEEVAAPYVNTLTLLRKKYEKNLAVAKNENGGTDVSTSESNFNNDKLENGDSLHSKINQRAIEDQRKFREGDAEDSYFNDLDDDDDKGDNINLCRPPSPAPQSSRSKQTGDDVQEGWFQ